VGLRNTREGWGVVGMTLHWGMAALILTTLPLGWVAAEWPLSRTKITLFAWHKSIGIALLVLVAVRLLWRAIDRAPPLPEAMSALERGLARAAHAVLYGLLVAIPVSGWVINSAANFPFKVFGLVPLPAIVEPSKATQRLAEDVHLALFWALATLLTVHVAAALRHHFVLRDEVLLRMLPVALRRRDGPGAPP
jgi:cytochrome b561